MRANDFVCSKHEAEIRAALNLGYQVTDLGFWKPRDCQVSERLLASGSSVSLPAKPWTLKLKWFARLSTILIFLAMFTSHTTRFIVFF